MTDPLIVSAVLAADVQDDLDARRRRYFPANKVGPDEARRTLAGVRAGHEPYGTVVESLALWRYRGGPWEAAGEFAFDGSGRTARPGA